MFASRRDLNNLFQRVRDIEKNDAVQEEKDNHLLEAFEKHDKQEMIKYDKIDKRLEQIENENKQDRKYRNYFVGGSILLGFLHEFGYISI